MKYVVKDYEDVFTPEFIEFIMTNWSGTFEKNHLVKMMEKIEQFEKREDLQFVMFFGNQFIIFKNV